MNVVETRLARATGTEVSLIDNRDGSFEALEGGLSARDGGWATLCAHGNYVLHGSRRLARSFLAAPEEWCDECREAA